MLGISKIADYGIVVAARLASRLGNPCWTVRELSEATGIPRPTVAKVMKALTAAHLAESKRGVHGGYQLARPPSAISALDLIEAFEGPTGVTECSTDGLSHDCGFEPRCEVRSIWQRVSHAVRDALMGIRLSDMTTPTRLVPLARSAQDAAGLRAASSGGQG